MDVTVVFDAITVGTFQTTATGTFSGTIAVPNLPAGPYTVTATDENALTGGILQAIDQGCFVVVSSQCAFGQADLSIYEVGRAAMDVGAMSAYDMTSEAALVKLAWVLGHTREPDRVKEMMNINYVGEMSYTDVH